MIKNTVIALITIATLSGIAAPAMADTNSLITSDSNSEDSADSFRATADQLTILRLREQGVTATSVEEWGGLVRAFVTLEDGRKVMQLYTPGSLQQVAL